MKTIRTYIITFIILASCQGLLGQKSTEYYIPVGQSPGLSGTHTVLGTLTEYKVQENSITMQTDEGTITLKLVGKPYVWLDNSGLGLSNKNGTFSDFQVGKRVEVCYLNQQKRDSLAWIKIEMKVSNKSP